MEPSCKRVVSHTTGTAARQGAEAPIPLCPSDALLSTVGPRPFRSNVHRGLFSPDVGARHRAGPAERIARSRSPAHGASRPPHRAGRTQHTRRPAAQTPPHFKPSRHVGVTSSSASRSASRSSGRRTNRGRSPTRGSRTRSRMCRRCRLPKRRSPRRNFRMASR